MRFVVSTKVSLSSMRLGSLKEGMIVELPLCVITLSCYVYGLVLVDSRLKRNLVLDSRLELSME